MLRMLKTKILKTRNSKENTLNKLLNWFSLRIKKKEKKQKLEQWWINIKHGEQKKPENKNNHVIFFHFYKYQK